MIPAAHLPDSLVAGSIPPTLMGEDTSIFSVLRKTLLRQSPPVFKKQL
jgi:hypothetical protein